MLKTW